MFIIYKYMKRFLWILSSILFILLSVYVVKDKQNKLVSTDTFTSGYATVLTNDCYFYSSPNYEDKVFLLEESYFVKVLEVYDPVFFKVQYLEFEGFVEKSKINFVEEFPKEPYLVGITFDIYDMGNVCLRSTPETLENDSNIVCTIKKSTKNLTYYGKCAGEEAIKGLGNIWYYSAFQDEYGNLYDDKQEITPISALTLTAQWEPKE